MKRPILSAMLFLPQISGVVNFNGADDNQTSFTSTSVVWLLLLPLSLDRSFGWQTLGAVLAEPSTKQNTAGLANVRRYNSTTPLSLPGLVLDLESQQVGPNGDPS